jgi:hypothetical protein
LKVITASSRNFHVAGAYSIGLGVATSLLARTGAFGA